MPAKLADTWPEVSIRGLIEGSLLAAFFFPELESVGALVFFVGGLLIAGSVVELWMALRLPGHAFRSILVFVALSGVFCGGFLLYHHPGTLLLLVVMFGLWWAIRGFAALWLGLSIVGRWFDRVLPVAAGIIGILGGGAVMLWFPADLHGFRLLLLVYGSGALLLYLALTCRLWIEQRRLISEAVSQGDR